MKIIYETSSESSSKAAFFSTGRESKTQAPGQKDEKTMNSVLNQQSPNSVVEQTPECIAKREAELAKYWAGEERKYHLRTPEQIAAEHKAVADLEMKYAAIRATGQPMLAAIRPTSKYFEGQAAGLFPVAIGPCVQTPPYNVLGNGNRYRLQDVFLFVTFGEGEPIQITF